MFLLMIVILSLLMLAIRPVHLPFPKGSSESTKDAPPVEEPPLQGEWIDGKAKSITRQEPLIGDVKALPPSWL